MSEVGRGRKGGRIGEGEGEGERNEKGEGKRQREGEEKGGVEEEK